MTGRQLFKTSAATALGYGRILVFGTDEDPDHLDTVVGRYEDAGCLQGPRREPQKSLRRDLGQNSEYQGEGLI
jgi:hypothetical protein